MIFIQLGYWESIVMNTVIAIMNIISGSSPTKIEGWVWLHKTTQDVAESKSSLKIFRHGCKVPYMVTTNKHNFTRNLQMLWEHDKK